MFERALPLLLLTALAGDWPQFRGPNGLGVSNDRGLPVLLGPEKSVIWKTPLAP